MKPCTRRELFAATGAVATGLVAGCLGDSDEDDDDPDGEDENGANETDEPAESEVSNDEFEAIEGTVLGDITVDNLHDQSHEVDVTVEINGDIEAWKTVTLDARDGGVTLDREWPTDGGTFRVRVRLDGDKFREVKPADWNDPDCVNIPIIIGHDGEVRIAGDTTSGPCAS